MKNILITGGAGYVGSRLVPYLLGEKYNIRVIDLFLFDPHIFDQLQDNPSLELIKGDIRDQELLSRCLKDIHAVIHLAAISNDPSCDLDPQLTRSINYDAVLTLIDLAKKQNIERFINASSASVYGIKEDKNVIEDLSLEPITIYAKYKAETEKYLIEQTTPDFATVSIRAATLCGYAPKLRLDLTVNILTYHAIRKGKITVFGGEQKRPNLHLQDIINLYHLLLEVDKEKISGKCFNAGFENYKVKEIAQLVKRTLNSNVEIETIPSNDQRSYHISTEKIRRELGFNPKNTVADAIKELEIAFDSDQIIDPDNSIYYNVKFMKKNRIS